MLQACDFRQIVNEYKADTDVNAVMSPVIARTEIDMFERMSNAGKVPMPVLSMIVSASAAMATAMLPAAASAQPVAQKFVESPPGTVSVFQRKTSGSFGNQEDRVTYNHGRTTWQGKPAVLIESPQVPAQVHDMETGAQIASLTRDGKPAVTYDPGLGYRYPFKVDDAWSSTHQVTNHASGKTTPITVIYKVEAYDSITVPAGKFNAYLVVATDSLGETQRVWTAPADGVRVVKRVVERSASHPQGAGRVEGEMVVRTLGK